LLFGQPPKPIVFADRYAKTSQSRAIPFFFLLITGALHSLLFSLALVSPPRSYLSSLLIKSRTIRARRATTPLPTQPRQYQEPRPPTTIHPSPSATLTTHPPTHLTPLPHLALTSTDLLCEITPHTPRHSLSSSSKQASKQAKQSKAKHSIAKAVRPKKLLLVAASCTATALHRQK